MDSLIFLLNLESNNSINTENDISNNINSTDSVELSTKNE